MFGIIWGAQYEKAKNKMLEVIQKYALAEIGTTSSTMDTKSFNVAFENGDTWRAMAVSQLTRGYRCNISYIDKNIPQNIVDTVIIPATTALPYSATCLY